MTPSLLLAQTARLVDVLPGLLVALGLLISAIVLLAIVLTTMRRRILKSRLHGADEGLFEQLRRLHEQGQISDDEFARIRDRFATRIRRSPDASSTPPENPHNASSDHASPSGASDATRQ